MSPHAAKARGIFDRAAVAPIGGHEGMPEDQALMGNAQSADENNEALISELSLFDAGAGEEDGGATPGTEDLAMAWPEARLVRSASMSSTGSGDAEESEVRHTHRHLEKRRYCFNWVDDLFRKILAMGQLKGRACVPFVPYR